MFESEKKKRKGDSTKKSASTVAEIVNEKYGTSISSRTIYRYCQNGMAGESPLHLVGTLESYIRINQGNGNGHALLKKTLIARVNNVFFQIIPSGELL